MKPLRVLGWLGVALLLAATTACQRGPSRTKVAFVSNNPESFWNIAEAGANKAAAETDVELFFQKPPRGDPAEQKAKIDQVMNQGIKAIAISVNNPQSYRRVYAAACRRQPRRAL